MSFSTSMLSIRRSRYEIATTGSSHRTARLVTILVACSLRQSRSSSFLLWFRSKSRKSFLAWIFLFYVHSTILKMPKPTAVKLVGSLLAPLGKKRPGGSVFFSWDWRLAGVVFATKLAHILSIARRIAPPHGPSFCGGLRRLVGVIKAHPGY